MFGSHIIFFSVFRELDKPARLIIRLLFGFASDSVFDKPNQSTNTETAMLSALLSTESIQIRVELFERRGGHDEELSCKIGSKEE